MMHITNVLDLAAKANFIIEKVVSGGGYWSYAVMFMVLFVGAAVVFTAPALPSTSLIFMITSLSASGFLNPLLSFGVLCAAICLGDLAAYWLGFGINQLNSSSKGIPFVKEEYLEKTKLIYEKADFLTIVLARFTPVIGSTAQLVAGTIRYNFKSFVLNNVVGGVIWLVFYFAAGWAVAVIPGLKSNYITMFMLVPIASIIVSIGYFVVKNRKILKEVRQ